eukprot:m.10956 g.10956  ORF g.10956 m.10956 type:complete len:340 (+) comp6772_c0_seq2:96-1115(+)
MTSFVECVDRAHKCMKEAHLNADMRRHEKAALLFLKAAEHFDACKKLIRDDGTLALYIQISATCKEQGKLHQYISSLNGSSATTTIKSQAFTTSNIDEESNDVFARPKMSLKGGIPTSSTSPSTTATTNTTATMVSALDKPCIKRIHSSSGNDINTMKESLYGNENGCEQCDMLEQQNKLLRKQQAQLLDLCSRLITLKDRQDEEHTVFNNIVMSKMKLNLNTGDMPDPDRLTRVENIFIENISKRENFQKMAEAMIQEHYIPNDMLETMKKNCADGIAELGHHAAESPHTPSPLNNFDEDSLELLSSVALSDTSPSPPKSQSSTTSTATATHHRDNSS